MDTANNTIGSTTESDRDESVIKKKEEYTAPKLTVVGTLTGLTLGTAFVGAADGIFQTGGGG